MTDYEQMEIDVRLESEKDLKTNVGKVIKFFYDKRRMEAEESGWPLKQVKGKHEGYGIAAEAFSKIGAKMKAQDNQEGAEFEEAEESQGGEENGDGEPQEEAEGYDPDGKPGED